MIGSLLFWLILFTLSVNFLIDTLKSEPFIRDHECFEIFQYLQNNKLNYGILLIIYLINMVLIHWCNLLAMVKLIAYNIYEYYY